MDINIKSRRSRSIMDRSVINFQKTVSRRNFKQNGNVPAYTISPALLLNSEAILSEHLNRETYSGITTEPETSVLSLTPKLTSAERLNIWRKAAATRIAELTPRQLEIMNLVLLGYASKNIAVDLHISRRTVENHRAEIMKRTRTHSLPALARLAFVATWDKPDEIDHQIAVI